MSYNDQFYLPRDRSSRRAAAMIKIKDAADEARAQPIPVIDISAYNREYVPSGCQWCELCFSDDCHEVNGARVWSMYLTNTNIIVCLPCLREEQSMKDGGNM